MVQSKLEKHYCINCGKEATELHHVVPLALGGNDIESNKVYVCSECHTIIHGTNKEHRGTYWKELQRMGIEKAKKEGKYKGRKPIDINWELFAILYNQWKNKKITATNMMQQLELKSNTFYRKVKEYEEKLNH